MGRLLDAVRHPIAAFGKARDGNVAIVFAIALIPMVGLAGGAIDYSRASSVKAAMQAALDATALAMAKQAGSMSASQLDRKSEEYFKAAFHRPDAKRVKISASYSTNGAPTVTVTGSAVIRTNFLGLLGINQIPIEAMARTVWGASRMRIALALDNTGSMKEDDKIGILKTSVRDLLKTLQNASRRPGDIEVAIVPFANGVNVGTGNAGASWIDWSYYAKSGGSGDDDDNDDRDYTWNGNQCKWSTCWQGTGSWNRDATTSNKSSWQGCVMDRDQNYDVTNTPPSTANPSTLFPALYEPNCPAPLLKLTDDWTALRNKVDSLVATGTTNQSIGLAWGWLALSSGAPLHAGSLPPKTERILILLTDGVNTENRWTTNTSSIDDRTARVCSNIKSDGITVFTILVLKGNATLLKNCASDPGKFFNITAPSQMADAFKQIGTTLTRLRLAK